MLLYIVPAAGAAGAARALFSHIVISLPSC